MPAYWPPDLRKLERALARQRRGRLVPVGRTDRLRAFKLKGQPGVRRSFGSLAVWERPSGGQRPAQVAAAGQRAKLDLRLTNHSVYPFVHPEPLLPSDVVLRWATPRGIVAEQRVRALLPLALLPRAEWVISREVDVPAEPGAYEVTLRPAATPRLVLAAEAVDVR